MRARTFSSARMMTRRGAQWRERLGRRERALGGSRISSLSGGAKRFAAATDLLGVLYGMHIAPMNSIADAAHRWRSEDGLMRIIR